MDDWKTRFLTEIYRLKRFHFKIKRMILSPDANSMLLLSTDINTVVRDEYITEVGMGENVVPVTVNLGQRSPVIIIEFIDTEGFLQSTVVHRDIR